MDDREESRGGREREEKGRFLFFRFFRIIEIRRGIFVFWDFFEVKLK